MLILGVIVGFLLCIGLIILIKKIPWEWFKKHFDI